MLGRCKFFGLVGAAALVAGMLLFIIGPDFATHWARWVFGPLLWFVGCALIICWAFSASCQAANMESSASANARAEKNVRTANRAS